MCIKLREGVEWFSYVCLFVFLYFVSLTRLHLTLMLQKSPLDGKKLAKKGGYRTHTRNLQGTFQHLCRKVPQGERNTCDRNKNAWAFSIDFRTGYHRPFVSPCPWHTNPHHFTLLLILEILKFKSKDILRKKSQKSRFSSGLSCFRRDVEPFEKCFDELSKGRSARFLVSLPTVPQQHARSWTCEFFLCACAWACTCACVCVWAWASASVESTHTCWLTCLLESDSAQTA